MLGGRPRRGQRKALKLRHTMGAFVSEHAELLTGYLGAQQMQAPVAWRPKASCSPFDQAGKYEGEPPLPRDANARQDFCSLFTCGDKQEEAQAEVRHEQLRRIIAEEERKGTRRQDHWAESQPVAGKRKR